MFGISLPGNNYPKSTDFYLNIEINDWMKKLWEHDNCIDHDPLSCFSEGDEIDMLLKVVWPGEKKGVDDVFKLSIPKLSLPDLKKMVSENQSIRLMEVETLGQWKLASMLMTNYQALTAQEQEMLFHFVTQSIEDPIAFDQKKFDPLVAKLINMVTVKDPHKITLDFYGSDFWLSGERVTEYYAVITDALQKKRPKEVEKIMPKKDQGEIWPIFPVDHFTR